MEPFLLKMPITFDGVRYAEFDLSGLDDLTGADYASLLQQAEKIDGETLVPEKTITFTCLAAAKVTGLPYDLFCALKAKDAARLRYEVGKYFLAED